MNISTKKALLPALIGSIVALSACGGGSDSNTPTANKTLTTGVITGFGSVYVNGCKYETNDASIDSDDVAANGAAGQANLDVGMVVTVSGSSETDANGNCVGTADRIIYDNDVEGPVATGSLTQTTDSTTGAVIEVSAIILGQTVVMNLDTVFKSESDAPYDLASVKEGDVLEVSGLMDGNGNLVATRVELQDEKMRSGNMEYEIKGLVANLDTTAMSFEVNGQPIDYGSNTKYDDMTAGDLVEGLYVEVKGMLDGSGARLQADKIQAEDDGMEKGQEYHSELEGVISNYDPDSMSFTLQGMMVDASSPDLKLEPMGLVLGDGLRVEVEGELAVADDGSATLKASKIKKKGDKIKIQARISAIDPDTDPSATLVDLDVFGKTLTIRVNQQTQFENGIVEGQMYAVGDFVEVEAFDDGTGVINAIELKVQKADDVELKGPVDAYDTTGMTVTLFGFSFDISQAEMKMNHMMPPQPADFWTAVDGQGQVKLVDWYPADGVIDKVEVDSD